MMLLISALLALAMIAGGFLALRVLFPAIDAVADVLLRSLFRGNRTAAVEAAATDTAWLRLRSVVETSIERYKEKTLRGNEWFVKAKRYSLRIKMLKQLGHFEIRIQVVCRLPYSFALERPPALLNRIREALNWRTYPVLVPIDENAPHIDPRDVPLQRLTFFDSISVHSTGVQAVKTLKVDDSVASWPEGLAALILLARYLLDSLEAEEFRVSGEQLCPYCRGGFTDSEPRVACRDCHTLHHGSCWEESGRCSVFGCAGHATIEVPV